MNKMIQEKDIYSVLILLVFKINNLIKKKNSNSNLVIKK
jgi:hypothetical protein